MAEHKFYGPKERKTIDPDPSTYMPIKDCRPGYLYHINARNASYGIYKDKESAFEIARTKWPDFDPFLFDEYHYDTGAPYGTVLPIKELEKCPDDILKDDARRLVWIKEKEKEYEPDKTN